MAPWLPGDRGMHGEIVSGGPTHRCKGVSGFGFWAEGLGLPSCGFACFWRICLWTTTWARDLSDDRTSVDASLLWLS